jgi:hypothetical protein
MQHIIIGRPIIVMVSVVMLLVASTTLVEHQSP